MSTKPINATAHENCFYSIFLLYFFVFPMSAIRIAFVKYLISQLTPMPPTMQAAGAMTSSSLTITDEKYTDRTTYIPTNIFHSLCS